MSSSSSRPAPIRSFIVASTVRRSPRRSATAPTAAPATVSASPPTSDGRICSTPRAVSASSPEFRASEQRNQKSTVPKEESMSRFVRRDFLKASAVVAAGAAAGPLIWVRDANAQWSGGHEKGVKLRVLRWSRFVQGDIDQYMVNVKKFSDKYGIEVRVDNEGWEDVRPKAAVAANTGAGPDIILSTNDDANLYPDKLVDTTDVCEYLGKKYGGWYPACEAFLKPDGKKWIGVPLGGTGSMIVYRESMVKAAGFDKIPGD